MKPDHCVSHIEEHAANDNITFLWIHCSCGWSHMLNKAWRLGANVEQSLKREWDVHAYTKEEMSILSELGGDYGWWP